MKNNNYVLYYKTNENDHWHSLRPDLPFEQWEDYAKEQGYTEYNIKDLKSYGAMMLHLTTDNVLLDGRYYLPEEKIDYPNNMANYIEDFEIETVLEEENEKDEEYFDEVYNKDSICWNFGYLWTDITTKFIFLHKTIELSLIAQEIVENLPKFIADLEKNSYAVYINMEFSKFKWLAWVREDKVRLIHQTYEDYVPEIEFDNIVDKDWFFDFCKDLIKTMKEYADKDLKRYQEYALRKYCKICKNSIPEPKTKSLNIDKFEIRQEVNSNDNQAFEDKYNKVDELHTSIWTYLTLKDKEEEEVVVLIAEQFADKFPDFLKELKQIENSVYEDMEYTETKLYGWLKDNSVRLVYQDFSCDEHEIIFDITVNKDWFFETAKKMIKQLEEITDKEYQRYKKYIYEKYGKN